MEDLKDKTIRELAIRLNLVDLRQQKLVLDKQVKSEEYKRLNDEYNAIVKELWNRIPTLRGDVNVQLRKGKRL